MKRNLKNDKHITEIDEGGLKKSLRRCYSFSFAISNSQLNRLASLIYVSCMQEKLFLLTYALLKAFEVKHHMIRTSILTVRVSFRSWEYLTLNPQECDSMEERVHENRHQQRC